MKHILSIFVFLVAPLAFADAQSPFVSGQYTLTQVPYAGTVLPPQPTTCGILKLMTVVKTADGFTATVNLAQVAPCSPAVDWTQHTYHFTHTGDFFCGSTYESKETISNGQTVGGGGLAAAIMNDYRSANADCLHPTDGRPAIVPVISLQEMTGDFSTWDVL